MCVLLFFRCFVMYITTSPVYQRLCGFNICGFPNRVAHTLFMEKNFHRTYSRLMTTVNNTISTIFSYSAAIFIIADTACDKSTDYASICDFLSEEYTASVASLDLTKLFHLSVKQTSRLAKKRYLEHGISRSL